MISEKNTTHIVEYTLIGGLSQSFSKIFKCHVIFRPLPIRVETHDSIVRLNKKWKVYLNSSMIQESMEHCPWQKLCELMSSSKVSKVISKIIA